MADPNGADVISVRTYFQQERRKLTDKVHTSPALMLLDGPTNVTANQQSHPADRRSAGL
jgi:hypothetical protein